MRGDVKRFPWIAYAVVLVLIVLVAAAPIISVMISSAIAEAHGCTLNEGRRSSLHYRRGRSRRGTANDVRVGLAHADYTSGWRITFGMWAIVLLVHRTKWNRKRRMAATEPAGISGPRLRA